MKEEVKEEEKKKEKLYFDSYKKEDELLKYKDCSAAMGPLYKDDFYACSSVSNTSYYLCTFCALNCHKGHEDRKVSKGNFKCSCAEKNHECPKIDRTSSGSLKCFYQQFFEKTPNSGYFSVIEGGKRKEYCAVCFNYCRSKEDRKKKDAKIEESKEEGKCCCSNHDVRNAVLLQGDLFSHRGFTQYLRNFNSNIFFTNEISRGTMINFLIEKIKLCKEQKKSKSEYDEATVNFLVDSNIEAILNLFYIGFFDWKNKFFYLDQKGFYKKDSDNKEAESKKFEGIISGMMSIINYQTGSNQYQQCKLQLYLANILFSILVRGDYISKNNLWNIHTIANMSHYQRMKYIIKPVVPTKEKKRKIPQMQKELIKSILEVYDRLLRDYYADPNGMENIKIEIFPLLNKLMKFAIKYNIADEDDSSKYFELVEETIKFVLENESKSQPLEETQTLKRKPTTNQSSSLFDEDKDHTFKLLSLGSNRDSMVIINMLPDKVEAEDSFAYTQKSYILIMKSIFYYLLYTNDKMVDSSLHGKNPDNKFVFNTHTKTLDKIKYSFFHILYDENNKGCKEIGFYQIVSKIFNLMCEKKKNFYYEALGNLLYTSHGGFDRDTKPNFNDVAEFINKSRDCSRNYFTYYTKLKEYEGDIEKVLTNFKTAFEKKYTLPNINIPYFFLIDDQNKINPNIKYLQHFIRNSLIFVALEEIIQIIGFASAVSKDKGGDEEEIPSLEMRKFILEFLCLIVQDAPEILNLIMNIKARCFVLFFNVIETDLYNFYIRILEMIFSTDYYFGNFNFIMKSISELFKLLNKKNTDIIKFFKLLTCLLKMLTIVISKYHVNYQLDIWDVVIEIYESITKNKIIGHYIKDYLNNSPLEKPAAKEPFINFLAQYLEFLAILYSSDISSYCTSFVIKDDLISLSALDKMIQKFCSASGVNESALEVKLIYPILRYFIQKSLPLKTNVVYLYDYMANMLTDLDQNATSFLNNKNIGLINQMLRKNNDFSPISKEEINSVIFEQVNKIFELLEIIDNILDNYDAILTNYILTTNKFEDYLSFKLTMYKFYENIFIKPTYYLFKNLELYLVYIEGRRFEMLMRIIFHLIKVTQIFYMNINDLEKFDKRARKDLNQVFGREFYMLEGIHVKTTLTTEEINKLKDFLIELKIVKFYQVKEVFQVYNKLIIHVFDYEAEIHKEEPNNGLPPEKIKQIKEFSEKYLELLDGKNEFICLQKEFFDIKILNSNYFKILTKDKEGLYTVNGLKIQKIKEVNHFISLMEFISDFNYIGKNEDNDKVIQELKNAINQDHGDFYLMLITLSNINEVLRTFELHSKKEFENVSIHSYINFSLTKLFQILCEGNQIEMKKYLFDYYISKTDFGLSLKKQVKELKEKKDKESKVIQKKKPAKVKHQETIIDTSQKLRVESGDIRGSKAFISNRQSLKRGISTDNNMIEEKKDIQYLSFFNIIATNMRILVLPLQKNDNFSLTSDIIKKMNTSIYSGINNMFEGYKNLLIEMIQGVSFRTDSIFSLDNPKKRSSSGFYFLCCDLGKFSGNVRQTTGQVNLNSIFDPVTEQIKLNFLEIIDNILKQSFKKSSFNFVFKFLSETKRHFYIGEIIKYIYLKYVDLVNPDSPDFETKFYDLTCEEIQLKKLVKIYKKDPTIYQDNYLKMACLLHYILKSLCDKLHITDAIEYFELSKKNFADIVKPETPWPQDQQKKEVEEKKEGVVSLQDQKSQKSEEGRELERASTIGSRKGSRSTKSTEKRKSGSMDLTRSEKQIEQESRKRESEMKEKKDKIHEFMVKNTKCKMMASKFLNKILKSVSISEKKKQNDTNSEMEIKNVYFQLTPETYIIDKKCVDNFMKTACRDNRSSKLKSILEKLPDYRHEIEYKHEHMTSRKFDWLYNFDYLNIDIFNCAFCFILNMIYLLALNKNEYSVFLLNKLSTFMEMLLILVNLVFIGFFAITKYPLNVSLLKVKFQRKIENSNIKMYPWDYFKIYFLDSFLLSEELSLMILVTCIGIAGCITRFDIIFFSFQLLTIGKFVSTIKEIIDAFVIRIGQLVSMVVFLAIIMFAFANYDYYFLKQQYLLEQEDGSIMDTCSTLLECFITLFNNGVRSGGGIGDLLPELPFFSMIYLHRWVHDMIFFIIVSLLLLNMINGVIVTTFSQIREDSSNKEDDKNNICFICSIPRYEVEKQGLSFEEHIKSEHCVKTYIRYLLSLYLMDTNDMDQDQYYVYNCLKKNGVEFFPIFIKE